jgi:Cof subfamily protein (haloacid dehalogenase superfamily)
LALDIDGTLLTSAKQVSPRTRAALDAARRRDVRLVLVTGRRYPAARRIAELVGGEPPLVLHNGALIVDEASVLRCRPLPVAAARLAIEIGKAQHADPVVHWGQQAEGQLLVEDIERSNTLLAYYLDKSHPDVQVVDDLGAHLHEDPIQVMFGGAIAAMDALLPALVLGLLSRARVERTLYPQQGVAILDVVGAGVNKAEALAFLQQRFGVSSSETLAIGDNWNDHEMLVRAGRGLLMGNADPDLRALGLELLPTNDEDGVAIAVERYLLA